MGIGYVKLVRACDLMLEWVVGSVINISGIIKIIFKITYKYCLVKYHSLKYMLLIYFII